MVRKAFVQGRKIHGNFVEIGFADPLVILLEGQVVAIYFSFKADWLKLIMKRLMEKSL